MNIGMTLPGMERGLDRQRIMEWCRRVDAGPFSSLAFGERMAFYNPELISMLGACAVLTERVRLSTTIIVMPLHNPVMLAKQLATLDVLCEGRLSVGLGIGGRREDHLAVSADPARIRNAALAEDVAVMRRVWRGEEVVPGLHGLIEPKPVQPGGPELLAGAMGPRAVRLAATWADGLTGFSWGADPDEVAPIFEMARKAWAEEGRDAPKLKTGFWVAVGEGARDQLAGHLGRYLSWLSPAEREQAMKGSGFAGSAAELRELLRRLEDLGAEEVNLVSTRGEPDEVDRLADAVGK